MSDILLDWNAIVGHADLRLTGGQLATGADLVSAVVVSLFSDRLALPSDPVPPGTTDRRGWWGDTWLQLDNPGDLIGSRLWLLARAKSDANLPRVAQGYIAEALQWLIDDGVAQQVIAKCFFLQGDQSRMGAAVTIVRRNSQPATLEFDWAWQQLIAA